VRVFNVVIHAAGLAVRQIRRMSQMMANPARTRRALVTSSAPQCPLVDIPSLTWRPMSTDNDTLADKMNNSACQPSSINSSEALNINAFCYMLISLFELAVFIFGLFFSVTFSVLATFSRLHCLHVNLHNALLYLL